MSAVTYRECDCGQWYQRRSDLRRAHAYALNRMPSRDLRYSPWPRPRSVFEAPKVMAALTWLRSRLGLVRAADFCPMCGCDFGRPMPQ